MTATADGLKEIRYAVCTRCVMDTTDPDITFDSEGVCNHCRGFATLPGTEWFPNEEGRSLLEMKLEAIRFDGAGKEYDCILGLSGGVDSSYLALLAKDWGLRPLVVHVDAGWNSELAVANIEKLVRHCGYDLHTHVVDWEEMRDLQLAYLRSGISNQDVPQDHIFFSSLYHFAAKHRIRHILSGGNIATEAIFPHSWHGNAMDDVNLRAIHRKFGTRPLKKYRTISFWQYYFVYPFMKKMRTLRPLNYMPYDKSAALKLLVETVGYKPYARKHGESVFTRFFQNHYLPLRFGYDKRRPHLSSLIASGQMTREEAISQLQQPLYDPAELEIDINYFCKKLRIDRQEFASLLRLPPRSHRDFPNFDQRLILLKKLQRFVQRLSGQRLNVYS